MKYISHLLHWHCVVMLLLVMVMTGCIESDDHYILNPDGSGKLIHEAKFVMVDINIGGRDKTADEKAQEAVQKLLSESQGIDAWQDVSFSMHPDGRVAFKGTAYFPDLSRVVLKHGGNSLNMLSPSYRSENGKGVLELVWSEKDGDQKNSTESNLDVATVDASQLTTERAKYQQMKPMMAAMLGNLKLKQKFTLPAPVESFSNMAQDQVQDSVSIVIEGGKMLELVDRFISDDQWLLQQMSSGQDLGKNFAPDESFNEKLYGTAGPIQAVTAVAGKAQFDYPAEMEFAKAAMPAMLQQLGFGASVVVTQMHPPAAGEGFEKLMVGGLRIVRDVGNDSIRPFNWTPGLSVSITGTFAGSVMDVKDGEVTHAESLAGENLLPEQEFDRTISFPSLSDDGRMVTFEVKLNAPQKTANGIKRLTGSMEYWISTGTREVDLGLTRLATGTKSSELGGMIGEYSENQWGNNTQHRVELELKVDVSQIKEVKFIDNTGQPMQGISKSGHSGFDQSVTMNFSSDKPFPAEGNIIVILYDDIKKFTIPFEVGPFNWLGLPVQKLME